MRLEKNKLPILYFHLLSKLFQQSYALGCKNVNESAHEKNNLIIVGVYEIDVEVLRRSKGVRNQIDLLGNSHFYISHVEIAEALNYSLTYNLVTNGWFGIQLANGSWDGLVQDLINCKADITMFMGLTHPRSKVVDFSYPIEQSSVSFITGKGTRKVATFVLIRRPVTVYIIIGIILSTLVIVISFSMIIVIFENASGETNSSYSVLNNAISLTLDLLLMLMKSSLEQSTVHDWTLSFSKEQIKIFLASWLLSLIILSNEFKSDCVSSRLSPGLNQPPDTFEELLMSKFISYAGELSRSALDAEIHSLNTTFGKSLSKRLVDIAYFKVNEPFL
jgi:hypothetical protein